MTTLERIENKVRQAKRDIDAEKYGLYARCTFVKPDGTICGKRFIPNKSQKKCYKHKYVKIHRERARV